MDNKQRCKERYYWLKEHKICCACGQNDAYPNETRCLECRFAQIEATQKYKKNHYKQYSESQKQYQRKLRLYRKKHGLCQQCGRPTNNGQVFCTEHALVRKQRQAYKRRERGIMPRELMGNGEFCYFCGERVLNYGDKVCQECLKREQKGAEYARKFIDYENSYFKKTMDIFFIKDKDKER